MSREPTAERHDVGCVAEVHHEIGSQPPRLSSEHIYRMSMTAIWIGAAVAVICLVGLGALVATEKLKATINDVTSGLLAIVAISLTIVFSRLSTDIRKTGERVEFLIAAGDGNIEKFRSCLATAMNRIESSLAGLQPTLDFERMLRSLASAPQPQRELPTEQRPVEAITEQGAASAHSAEALGHVRQTLSCNQIAILRIFWEAGENVLSSEFLSRRLTQVRIKDGDLRVALQALSTNGCITLHSTAVALTELGVAVVNSFDEQR